MTRGTADLLEDIVSGGRQHTSSLTMSDCDEATLLQFLKRFANGRAAYPVNAHEFALRRELFTRTNGA
jgi:hypothetical protein